MDTIRNMLNKLDFDWDTAEIVYQSKTNGTWGTWSDNNSGIYIDNDHPILDLEHDTSYGSADTPCFVAKDKNAIYFPAQYDGATWVEKVWLDLDFYTGLEFEETPYPGG